MKVTIIGILAATYLVFSYKSKSLLFYWREQVVEISILLLLIISVLASYKDEMFVWMLLFCMIGHQVIQLSLEVSGRLKKQKVDRMQIRKESVRFTA